MHEYVNTGTVFKGKEAVAEIFFPQGSRIVHFPLKMDSGLLHFYEQRCHSLALTGTHWFG